MDKTSNYLSENKQMFQRGPATEYRGKTHKNVVCFPSTRALDVKDCFNNGVLDENSTIIAVEKVKSRRGTVAKQLKSLTSNFVILPSDAHRLNIKRYLDGGKIDFMPFDICGNFTAQLAGWFYRNQVNFADGMRMSITLAAINRQPKSFNVMKKVAGKGMTKLVSKALSNSNFTAKAGLFITPEMRDNVVFQVCLFLCSMPDKDIRINNISIYSNKGDRKGKFITMMAFDADVFDSERDNYRHRIIEKFSEAYNENSCAAAKIVMEKYVKTSKPKKDNTESGILSGIVKNMIQEGIDNKGVVKVTTGKKAYVTRLCNKTGSNPVRVWSSVKSWVWIKSGKKYKGVIKTVATNKD